MLIALHKNATTTPATRLAIQQASGSDYELAERFNVGRSTIRKWRQRHGVQDASHTPHRLQTTLNAGQEELVVYLRSQLRLPLDDLLAVIHEFIELRCTVNSGHRMARQLAAVWCGTGWQRRPASGSRDGCGGGTGDRRSRSTRGWR